ncbi:MAG: hypothetical protein ACK55Z_08250, partial [bacterium]
MNLRSISVSSQNQVSTRYAAKIPLSRRQASRSRLSSDSGFQNKTGIEMTPAFSNLSTSPRSSNRFVCITTSASWMPSSAANSSSSFTPHSR